MQTQTTLNTGLLFDSAEFTAETVQLVCWHEEERDANIPLLSVSPDLSMKYY